MRCGDLRGRAKQQRQSRRLRWRRGGAPSGAARRGVFLGSGQPQRRTGCSRWRREGAQSGAAWRGVLRGRAQPQRRSRRSRWLVPCLVSRSVGRGDESITGRRRRPNRRRRSPENRFGGYWAGRRSCASPATALRRRGEAARTRIRRIRRRCARTRTHAIDRVIRVDRNGSEFGSGLRAGISG